MQVFHGSHAGTKQAFRGICLTTVADVAYGYGQQAIIVGDLDMDGLMVLTVEGYDRDENIAPGDDGDALGADVLVFEDEDQCGATHTTYRLMSDRAVGALRVDSVMTGEDFFEEYVV